MNYRISANKKDIIEIFDKEPLLGKQTYSKQVSDDSYLYLYEYRKGLGNRYFAMTVYLQDKENYCDVDIVIGTTTLSIVDTMNKYSKQKTINIILEGLKSRGIKWNKMPGEDYFL